MKPNIVIKSGIYEITLAHNQYSAMTSRWEKFLGKKMQFVLIKIFRRILKVVDRHYLFVSSKGIKSINSKLNLQSLDSFTTQELSPEQLFLFIDGLVNEETLADLNIAESPHYQLISRMIASESFMDCDYVIRAEAGTLDMRPPTLYSVAYYQERHNELMAKIRKGGKDPILVLQLKEKYYMLDGKHRAAYFATQNQRIEAKVFSSLKGEPFTEDVYQKMAKNNSSQFSKNLDLLKIALEKEEISNN